MLTPERTNCKKLLLFADAVEIFGGSDEQVAISNGYRRLNSWLVYLCLEDNFELIAACGEHYDLPWLITSAIS